MFLQCVGWEKQSVYCLLEERERLSSCILLPSLLSACLEAIPTLAQSGAPGPSKALAKPKPPFSQANWDPCPVEEP
jgi:hypothetical protein